MTPGSKKITKGIKKRLNATLPEGVTVSHHFLMQMLSQEMFSMSYEEAKSTLLSEASCVANGLPVVPVGSRKVYESLYAELSPLRYEDPLLAAIILEVRDHVQALSSTSKFDPVIITDAIWCTVTLNSFLPTDQFPELYGINSFISKLKKNAVKAIDSLIENVERNKDNYDTWEQAAVAVHRAFFNVMRVEMMLQGSLVTIDSFLSRLTLESMISSATNKKIPHQTRAPLLSLLSRLSPTMDEVLNDTLEVDTVSEEHFTYLSISFTRQVSVLNNLRQRLVYIDAHKLLV